MVEIKVTVAIVKGIIIYVHVLKTRL